MPLLDPPDEPIDSVTPTIDQAEALLQGFEAHIDPLSTHPIASAITQFLHGERDIWENVTFHVPLAFKRMTDQLSSIQSALTDALPQLASSEEVEQVLGIKVTTNSLRDLHRLIKTKTPQVLTRSLFIGMFSIYDAFIGELLAAIYRKKPELLHAINRSVLVVDVMKYASFDAFRESIISTEVEAFRRKSYIEQFEDMEATFGLKLRALNRWPDFVECSQRRNILTHGNGIVSEQYIRVCTKQGYKFIEPVVVGQELNLSRKYFEECCNLLMEVGLKLGQTLWRKLFPEELDKADDHLRSVVYENLVLENWKQAQVYGEFSLTQRTATSDLDRRISVINYVIALKFGGAKEQAAKVLAAEDWSAAILDFRLAEAVLSERYDDAADFMERIGKSGERVKETSYHTWPLFREFRQTTQFIEAYERVYGYPFTEELQRTADAAQAAATQGIQGQFEFTVSQEESSEAKKESDLIDRQNPDSDSVDTEN